MFKTVNKDVWVFDVEWIPDPEAGRRLFELPMDCLYNFNSLKIIFEKFLYS